MTDYIDAEWVEYLLAEYPYVEPVLQAEELCADPVLYLEEDGDHIDVHVEVCEFDGRGTVRLRDGEIYQDGRTGEMFAGVDSVRIAIADGEDHARTVIDKVQRELDEFATRVDESLDDFKAREAVSDAMQELEGPLTHTESHIEDIVEQANVLITAIRAAGITIADDADVATIHRALIDQTDTEATELRDELVQALTNPSDDVRTHAQLQGILVDGENTAWATDNYPAAWKQLQVEQKFSERIAAVLAFEQRFTVAD